MRSPWRFLALLHFSPLLRCGQPRSAHRESSSLLSFIRVALASRWFIDLWGPLTFMCVFISLIKVRASFICLRELSVSSSPPLHFFTVFFFTCFVCLHWPGCLPSRRDFAYVARDKNTRILKCHVFRCDTPAKAIATSLHEICSRVRTWGQRTYSYGYQYARGYSARVCF